MRVSVVLLAGLILLGLGCGSARGAPAATAVRHAAWAENAVIYELNTRQFTPQGTFRAILPRISELKALGVSVVWFMPIHPIGMKNRKGTLGSPYSVRDYMAVNPEFGTLDDFKAVVSALHQAGMHVIIDLVANHTAWDNPLAARHPDWYAHDAAGRFVPPVPSWSDVIQLDYKKPGLRAYMIKVMEYWVRDVGIDGFRCDFAGNVPTSFWSEARRRLDAIRPVFMLAEAEKPALVQKAFDADYASELYHIFNRIARGQARPSAIDRQLRRDRRRYPAGSWRMLFTSNHDQNTWDGTALERLGRAGAKAFAALTFTLPGRPLIYDGQEVGNAKRLAFFERDPIAWRESGFRPFYTKLCHLYRRTPALYRGSMERVKARGAYAFVRRYGDGDPVLVVANLSRGRVRARVALPLVGADLVVGGPFTGTFKPVKATDLISGETIRWKGSEKRALMSLSLAPWDVRILRLERK